MPRVQPVCGPDGANVLAGEPVSTLHIFSYEQRPAKNPAAAFVVPRADLALPQSFLRNPYRINHVFEFVRLQRERAVRTSIRARKSEMLFHNARSQCNRRN